MKDASINDIFSMARLWVRYKVPYFNSAVTSLQLVEETRIPSMGVTAKGVCYYNPNFVKTIANPESLGFALVHEALHLLKRHNSFFSESSEENKKRNIAMDFEINSSLGAAVGQCGLTMIFWPNDFDFPEGLTWEEYYRLMENEMNAGSPSGEKLKKLLEQGENGDNDGGVGAGQCGGAASNPNAIEEEYSGEGMTPERLERVRQNVANDIINAERGGKLPGSFSSVYKWASEVLAPPKLPWDTILRRKIRRGIAACSGRTESTYTKLSRRQSVYGYGDQSPILPGMISRVPSVWVVLDTSGSMFFDKIMFEAVSEVISIVRKFPRCTFIAADVDVTQKVLVTSPRQVLQNVAGGGGTEFDAAFLEALKEPPKKRPSVIVYVTDGHGSVRRKDYGIHTIWCLVGADAAVPAPWGEVVRVPTKKSS
jgi:predicted metal-dependent peptidase